MIVIGSVSSTALKAHEEFDRLYKQEHGKHTPCEADDGQCHMECPKREECHI